MRITANWLRRVGAAAVLGALLAATGCHTNDRSTGQAVNDEMTAHNVRHALSKDPVLKFPDVHVSVFNGNAQLTGFVSDEEQRAKAAEIASGVQGVRQVINEITLKPTPTGRAPIHDATGADVRNAPNIPPPPPRY